MLVFNECDVKDSFTSTCVCVLVISTQLCQPMLTAVVTVVVPLGQPWWSVAAKC